MKLASLSSLLVQLLILHSTTEVFHPESLVLEFGSWVWSDKRFKNHSLSGKVVFCPHANQSVRYLHSWLQSAILIKMSRPTNNPGPMTLVAKSVALKFSVKPNQGCLIWQELLAGFDSNSSSWIKWVPIKLVKVNGSWIFWHIKAAFVWFDSRFKNHWLISNISRPCHCCVVKTIVIDRYYSEINLNIFG